MSPQSVHAFAEKVALITDASNRIGRAAVIQLGLQGCFVIAGSSETGGAGKNVIDELRLLGTLADAVEADISRVEGAKKLVEAVHNTYGRLDLLVNCMKFRAESSFENTGAEGFARIVDANVRSVFFVTQAAVALMKDRPKPRIVNVISACDTPETKSDATFTITQAAVAELTRCLAATLPAKFRVNCIAVSEKKSAPSAPENALFTRDAGVPADDVARTILYLLSGEAAGLNGQILTVE